MSKEKQNKIEKGDALFEALSKNKKRKRRRIIRTVVIALVVIALVLVAVVSYLRRQVRERFASGDAEVLTYQVSRGTISTTVSGSGVLTQEDLESLSVPTGVEISEVQVEADDPVSKGDVLATVDMASVMSAMSALQAELDELDVQIGEAEDDEVSSYVEAGVDGRVKILYAQEGTDVASCMVEHGALAMLSLDGYMAVDIETDALSRGDAVTVFCGEKEYEGTVDAVTKGTATVLVTDNGPKYDEEVTVALDGTRIGKGKLYIHSSLAVTGYAGTVERVYVEENESVRDSEDLFYLEDTAYSANYDGLLRQRSQREEVLMELLTIYRDGAILSPMDGVVSSVDYTEDEETAAASVYLTGTEETEETALVTLYPDVVMSVTIGIDETDILALKEGQTADITVSSVSEEQVFTGTVTEISNTASTISGVTQYSAVVTLDKQEGMLPGMTAEVEVRIEGVENALIIPVEALHQTSNISFVYTSYNAETQEYGDRVEVTTGMQNSSYVEITSGLREGDTVYYTENKTFSFFDMMNGRGNMGGNMGGGFSGAGNGFGGNMGGSRSEMPDMGQMPSGGFGGRD